MSNTFDAESEMDAARRNIVRRFDALCSKLSLIRGFVGRPENRAPRAQYHVLRGKGLDPRPKS